MCIIPLLNINRSKRHERHRRLATHVLWQSSIPLGNGLQLNVGRSSGGLNRSRLNSDGLGLTFCLCYALLCLEFDLSQLVLGCQSVLARRDLGLNRRVERFTELE